MPVARALPYPQGFGCLVQLLAERCGPDRLTAADTWKEPGRISPGFFVPLLVCMDEVKERC